MNNTPQNKASTSHRLLARLRKQERVEATTRTAEILLDILSNNPDAQLARTHASSEQLAAGAWSWTIIGPPGTPEAGSYQRMTEVLKADRIILSSSPRDPAVTITGIAT